MTTTTWALRCRGIGAVHRITSGHSTDWRRCPRRTKRAPFGEPPGGLASNRGHRPARLKQKGRRLGPFYYCRRFYGRNLDRRRRTSITGITGHSSACTLGSSYRSQTRLNSEGGLDVSYETVRRWFLKFESVIVANPRRKRPTPSNHWHLDEMAIVN